MATPNNAGDPTSNPVPMVPSALRKANPLGLAEAEDDGEVDAAAEVEGEKAVAADDAEGERALAESGDGGMSEAGRETMHDGGDDDDDDDILPFSGEECSRARE